MVRYERPSLSSRCLLPFFRGLRRPFRPKIVRLLTAIFFWVLGLGWMLVAGNLTALRRPKDTAALPDVLFDILPEHQIRPLPEILLYVLLTSVVGRIIFHSDGVAIARRFAAISGCIYFLRGLTLVATSFPHPTTQCRTITPTWTPSSLLFGNCADVTLQVINLTLAALCWRQYTKSISAAVIAAAFALTGMLTLIMTRSSYTIDVFLSMLISMFVWKYYHMTVSVDRRNRIVKWLEKIDNGASGDSAHLQLQPMAAPGKYTELNESVGPSPVSARFNLNESLSLSPPSRFLTELSESLGSSPGTNYRELSCVVK